MATKKTTPAAAPTRVAAEDKKTVLDTAIAHIERSMGKGAIMKLGDMTDMNVSAVSTGSLSLDMALGVGGVPRGRIIEIYGPESSLSLIHI